MAVLAVDLGGTKLALAVFSDDGMLLHSNSYPLAKREGAAVGALITDAIQQITAEVDAIGIAVPGISRHHSGTVWAPNIPGWEDYPLLAEIKAIAGDMPVFIESDRSCYILGEVWQGNAQGCKDAIFLAVGTGIGAGILVNGELLQGAKGIAGAIGWMALDRPFQHAYADCGCFESMASGEGIVKAALQLILEEPAYNGILRKDALSTQDVFAAYLKNDHIAREVIMQCISLWGMATANLVSLFNPEKIIFGGGVFGPAVEFLPLIAAEAAKWAQPISMKQVRLEVSGLGNYAGLYGAAYRALQHPFHV